MYCSHCGRKLFSSEKPSFKIIEYGDPYYSNWDDKIVNLAYTEVQLKCKNVNCIIELNIYNVYNTNYDPEYYEYPEACDYDEHNSYNEDKPFIVIKRQGKNVEKSQQQPTPEESEAFDKIKEDLFYEIVEYAEEHSPLI